MIVTFPLKVLDPDAPPVIPPDNAARVATVNVKVPSAKTPSTVSVPAIVKFEAALSVMPPLTVRLFTDCATAIVPPDVFATIVDVPIVKVPALASIDFTVIVEPLAVRTPFEATVRVSVVMGKLDPDVDKVVVPDPPWTVRALATRRPFVAIVNVTVLLPLLNVTL